MKQKLTSSKSTGLVTCYLLLALVKCFMKLKNACYLLLVACYLLLVVLWNRPLTQYYNYSRRTLTTYAQLSESEMDLKTNETDGLPSKPPHPMHPHQARCRQRARLTVRHKLLQLRARVSAACACSQCFADILGAKQSLRFRQHSCERSGRDTLGEFTMGDWICSRI